MAQSLPEAITTCFLLLFSFLTVGLPQLNPSQTLVFRFLVDGPLNQSPCLDTASHLAIFSVPKLCLILILKHHHGFVSTCGNAWWGHIGNWGASALSSLSAFNNMNWLSTDVATHFGSLTMRASILPEWSSRRFAKHPDGDILVTESLSASITGSLSFGNEEFPKGSGTMIWFPFRISSSLWLPEVAYQRLASHFQYSIITFLAIGLWVI